MLKQLVRLAGAWIVVGLAFSVAAAAPARVPDRALVEAAAAQDWATVEQLLRRNVDPNSTRPDGTTALLWATHWDNQAVVDKLLAAGANPNLAEDHGVTALARAAENASAPLIERLLRSGADPNRAQTSGMTPLMIAAHTGNARVLRALIASGADVNARTSESGVNALMWAIAAPHPELVPLLIENGADVHGTSAKGFTALMFAAQNGDIETGNRLLAAGVGPNETAADGTHVLPFAILAGQAAFAEWLLGKGADPNGALGGMRALHIAAGPVDLWLDPWMRQHGRVRSARLSPESRLTLVKALLARGADANARLQTFGLFMNYLAYPRKGAFEPFACGTGDLLGATPLWVAALNANGSVGGFGNGEGAGGAGSGAASVEVIRALLDAGADQHLTTADGTTPFMAAAGLGRATFAPGLPRGTRSPSAEGAVALLLERGASINAVNEADFTALHGAAFRGLNEVIEFLVAKGANINARDFRGRTPYRLAEGAKQSFQFQAWPETARALERLGADINLGIPGNVQERLRDIGANAQQE